MIWVVKNPYFWKHTHMWQKCRFTWHPKEILEFHWLHLLVPIEFMLIRYTAGAVLHHLIGQHSSSFGLMCPGKTFMREAPNLRGLWSHEIYIWSIRAIPSPIQEKTNVQLLISSLCWIPFWFSARGTWWKQWKRIKIPQSLYILRAFMIIQNVHPRLIDWKPF